MASPWGSARKIGVQLCGLLGRNIGLKVRSVSLRQVRVHRGDRLPGVATPT